MENTPIQKLNELKNKIETLFSKDKIQEIQSTIASSIEETQEMVGSKIDSEMKKTLKGTMQFINGAKSELEGMQKKIKKLMGGAPRKSAGSKKSPAKKKTAKKAKSKTSKK
jgi:archaellum component FlaC